MKTMSTPVSTGMQVTVGGLTGKIGMYRNGLISVHLKTGECSGVTQQYTTKKLNQLIKQGKIIVT
jgi:hypothetical protein